MAAFFVSPWISDSTRFLFRQLKIILPSYSPLFALYFRFCSSTLYFASDSFKSLQPPQYTREQTSELISWGSKPAAGHYCCVANHYLINSNPDVGTNCTRRGKRGRHTSSKNHFQSTGGINTYLFSKRFEKSAQRKLTQAVAVHSPKLFNLPPVTDQHQQDI